MKNTDLIHEAYNKSYVAQRYYAEKDVDISREQARKNFFLLRKIDRQTLHKVMADIAAEQANALACEAD